MPLHDLLADRKADAGPGILPARVEALKRGENPVEVFLVESDSVILHHDMHHLATISVLGLGRLPVLDTYYRRYTGLVELDRIADEVLKQLPHLRRVRLDGG